MDIRIPSLELSVIQLKIEYYEIYKRSRQNYNGAIQKGGQGIQGRSNMFGCKKKKSAHIPSPQNRITQFEPPRPTPGGPEDRR